MSPPSRVADLVLEIHVDAPPERAWKALVHDAGAWWPKGFYTSARATRFVLEPKLGGIAYEDWGGGDGLVWYTVTTLEKDRRLELAGDLFPGFGGPARIFTRFLITPREGGCTVRLMETAFGHCTQDLEGRLREGWDTLLGAYKAWCEAS